MPQFAIICRGELSVAPDALTAWRGLKAARDISWLRGGPAGDASLILKEQNYLSAAIESNARSITSPR